MRLHVNYSPSNLECHAPHPLYDTRHQPATSGGTLGGWGGDVGGGVHCRKDCNWLKSTYSSKSRCHQKGIFEGLDSALSTRDPFFHPSFSLLSASVISFSLTTMLNACIIFVIFIFYHLKNNNKSSFPV